MPAARTVVRLWLLSLLLCFAGTAYAASARPVPVPGDRWIELDLYWFDPTRVEGSADAFWARYAPLYQNISGYKGVVLSLGLTANFILSYSGDLDQDIVLPQTGGQEIGHVVAGQLDGDTANRQRAWRQRFAGPAEKPSASAYGRWRYRDLKALSDALRTAARRHGIDNFRVASFATGNDGAYGAPMPFAKRHPEAFTVWREQAPGAIASSSNLDPANLLEADPNPLAAYPRGIAKGLAVHTLFAEQWRALSRDVGLDGIMLRDSFSYPRGFTRYGPFGPTVPDAAAAERITSGIATLIRKTKQTSPRTLVMMWSTAATATSDWRANGVDLERIANEGYLDIYVDQSWAGAWGEVGVREQTFWNAPILGWTYQLATLLQHAAVLAKSKVRHYPLIETFDAWESWDTLHTAPDRLRWAIWAYSHAGVKTPKGLKMPAGVYLSWGNNGSALWSEVDVAFLARELNAAAIDAAQTRDIAGPTMVYSRNAMAAQMRRLSPGFDVRDRTDEQVGSIIKWPLPVLSVTRAEWVPQVRSDLFVFGATEGISEQQAQAIIAIARRGQPMSFFGALDGGTDRRFAELVGVTSRRHRPAQQDRILQASSGPATATLALSNAPASFAMPPTTMLNTAPAASTVYAFGESTALAQTRANGLDVSLWDPAPLADYWYRPLRDLMYGEPAPFVYASATLNRQLADRRAVSAATDLRETGTIAAWTRNDGTRRLLAGNLEEGLRDDAERSRRLSISLPPDWGRCDVRGENGGSRVSGRTPNRLDLHLAPQGSLLLACAR